MLREREREKKKAGRFLKMTEEIFLHKSYQGSVMYGLVADNGGPIAGWFNGTRAAK